MKTRSRVFATMLVTGLFLTTFTFAQAQSGTAWTTSKGVQKVANKQLFNDENLQSTHIQAESVSPTWNISKGVHRKKGDDKVVAGNMVANENPSWVISKDLHRNNETMIAKRNAVSSDELMVVEK